MSDARSGTAAAGAPSAADGDSGAVARRPASDAVDGRSVSCTHLLDDRAERAPRPPLQRPTWVEVDLDAITANARALRGVASGSTFMAVIKADAYGHGMVPVARAAARGGADWFAVALIEEGRALRSAGVVQPTLLLTEPPSAAIPALLDAGLTPTVYTPGFARALDAEARRRADGPLDVHLQLDTGMRRVGVPPQDWPHVVDLLVGLDGLRVTGLWSHFACADEPGHPSVQRQSTEFASGDRDGPRSRARPGTGPSVQLGRHVDPAG